MPFRPRLNEITNERNTLKQYFRYKWVPLRAKVENARAGAVLKKDTNTHSIAHPQSNIDVDGWAGAYNPYKHTLSHPILTHTDNHNFSIRNAYFQLDHHGQTDGPADQPTDRRSLFRFAVTRVRNSKDKNNGDPTMFRTNVGNDVSPAKRFIVWCNSDAPDAMFILPLSRCFHAMPHQSERRLLYVQNWRCRVQ